MNPFEALITSPSTRKVSPDILEMLGHKAARDFLDKKMPLNQAVVAAVKEHPDLNNEHIKRVVEFANNVTFQEMFQANADKNIHFPVADPGVILRDLKDGGSPGHEQVLNPNNKDYMAPPAQQMQKDEELQDAFNDLDNRQQHEGVFGQGEPIEKNAYAVHLDAGLHANPIENVYDLHVKLQSSRDRLHEALDHFSVLEKQASDAFYLAAKKEVLDPDGAGLGGIFSVMEKIAGFDAAAVLSNGLVERLMSDGINPRELETSLEKKAGVLINPQHALPLAFASMIKMAGEVLRTEVALEEVEAGLSQTSTFLAKNA